MDLEQFIEQVTELIAKVKEQENRIVRFEQMQVLYMELEVLRNENMRLEEMISAKNEVIETMEAEAAKLKQELQYFKISDRLLWNRVKRLDNVANAQYDELNDMRAREGFLCADLNEAREAMDNMTEELVRLRQSDYYNEELKKALVELYEIIGGKHDV